MAGRAARYKYIPVAKLREMLDKLQENDVLKCNQIGNFSILRPDDSSETWEWGGILDKERDVSLKHVGFIDLLSEELDLDQP